MTGVLVNATPVPYDVGAEFQRCGLIQRSMEPPSMTGLPSLVTQGGVMTMTNICTARRHALPRRSLSPSQFGAFTYSISATLILAILATSPQRCSAACWSALRTRFILLLPALGRIARRGILLMLPDALVAEVVVSCWFAAGFVFAQLRRAFFRSRCSPGGHPLGAIRSAEYLIPPVHQDEDDWSAATLVRGGLPDDPAGTISAGADVQCMRITRRRVATAVVSSGRLRLPASCIHERRAKA